MTEPTDSELYAICNAPIAQAEQQGFGSIMAIVQGTKDGYRALYNAGKAAGAPRWIPCSERMPETGQDVLYLMRFDDQPRMGSRRKLDEQFYWGPEWGDYDHEVTHWMSLPSPPAHPAKEKR